MKTSKLLFYLMGLMIVIASVACSGDDDDDDNDGPCDNNWNPAIELEDEIAAINAAAQAYAMDQSKENCEAYKQSILDYLDEVRDWEECYILIGQQQEFIEAVEQAEEDAMNIQC
jgi:hypothetical protein